ncbi:MAG: polysaccharide pyruvyl transferase family protein [Bacillota bacterium]|jgi:polysaccharide pyruvyl transferase WcaK-like protein
MKTINIGLLWHTLYSNNLGCGALSIANILILDKVCRNNGITPHFVIGELRGGELNYYHELKNISYSVVMIPRLRKMLFNNRLFQDCDLIFDIYGGDSFADIYGLKNFFCAFLIRSLLVPKKCKYILAPQTIGPFKHTIAKYPAKWLLYRADMVFIRDNLSEECVRSIANKVTIQRTSDVAFVLPYRYDKVNPINKKKKIGVNISGMLYNNAFAADQADSFKKKILAIIRFFYEKGDCEVHLIPHVVGKTDSRTNDLTACKEVKAAYPNVILPAMFKSPIEAKSYIASLDLLIGSRMHATIAALSAGVPVIPMSYSRKFEGLFDSLGYEFLVDALHSSQNDTVQQIVNYFNKIDQLQNKVNTAYQLALDRIKTYEEAILKII